MRNHTKLKAFQLADELALAVYRSTPCFPAEERFGLAAQMRKAAVSTASNIVEGSTRETKADYIRFLQIAHGSAEEVLYQLSLAHRLGFLADGVFSRLDELAEQTCRVLTGLIRSHRRRGDE